jgi:hypothetical protein
MRDYIENACEEIDAAMFSGDAFMEKEERDALTDYIGRWHRKMKEWEEIAAEVVEENGSSHNSNYAKCPECGSSDIATPIVKKHCHGCGVYFE